MKTLYTIAIDFDNVIHDIKNIPQGKRMGPPIEGAKEALKEFHRKRYKIIIFSYRAAEPQHIEDWMKYFDIPYNEVTNIKPNADFFIDDKAIHFTSWKEIEII